MAVNAPDEEVKGIDVSAAYRWSNVLRGNLTFGLDATYNLEYKRDPFFTTDLVYRLSLPSDLTLTGAVFNVADRDPPSVRLADYNYDPFFGNPIGRAFKVGLTKQFR